MPLLSVAILAQGIFLSVFISYNQIHWFELILNINTMSMPALGMDATILSKSLSKTMNVDMTVSSVTSTKTMVKSLTHRFGSDTMLVRIWKRGCPGRDSPHSKRRTKVLSCPIFLRTFQFWFSHVSCDNYLLCSIYCMNSWLPIIEGRPFINKSLSNLMIIKY